MPDEQCPFCNLNTERNRILHEDQDAIVVLSNPRLMPGHVLVIPRRHVGALFELEPPAQYGVFYNAMRYQERMIKIFTKRWNKPAGCDLSVHTRPFMPTTQLSIPQHAHVHLRPRFWKDPYYEQVLTHETGIFEALSDFEKEEYQALLSLRNW
jgi:diadenosine tetraphosphate (Ap4A) HIT family hydrolase